MSEKLILQRIWATHITRPEGGGATHVFIPDSYVTLCGLHVSGSEGDEFDAAAQLIENVTDCGRCARSVKRRLQSLRTVSR